MIEAIPCDGCQQGDPHFAPLPDVLPYGFMAGPNDPWERVHFCGECHTVAVLAARGESFGAWAGECFAIRPAGSRV